MNPRTRKSIGNAFLVFTLICLTAALSNGGFLWAAVTVSAAITLWGIGGSKDERNRS